MSELNLCQSCAMPMASEEVQGTNADGTKNDEYCHYCLKDGKFGKDDETMEEMIETCIPFAMEAKAFPDENAARDAYNQLFPTLKRWQK